MKGTIKYIKSSGYDLHHHIKDNGGNLYYFRWPYYLDVGSYNYYLAKIDDKTVGMIETQRSPYDPKELWFKYITVDESARNIGLSKGLIDLLSRDLEGEDLILVISSFSKMGADYVLKNLANKLNEHGIMWRSEDPEMINMHPSRQYINQRSVRI